MKQILFVISYVVLFLFTCVITGAGFIQVSLLFGWKEFTCILVVCIVALFYTVWYAEIGRGKKEAENKPVKLKWEVIDSKGVK